MKKFKKNKPNENFDHKESVIKKFSDLGYNNVKIETFLTNGISYYVSFEVLVLNEKKLFMDMDVWGEYTDIQVRISDHYSNLDKFGNSKNKMTMACLIDLRESGAISKTN